MLTLTVAEHCFDPTLDLETCRRQAYQRAPTVGFGRIFKRCAQGTLDGDTGTHAAITGSNPEASQGGVPQSLAEQAWGRLKA